MKGWAYTWSDMLALNGYVRRIVNASLLLLEMTEQVMRDAARVGRRAQRLNVVGPARVTGRHRRRDARRNLEVDLRREAEVARPAAVGRNQLNQM